MKAERDWQTGLNLAITKEFDQAPNIIGSPNLKVTTGKLTCSVIVLMKRAIRTCFSVLLARWL